MLGALLLEPNAVTDVVMPLFPSALQGEQQKIYSAIVSLASRHAPVTYSLYRGTSARDELESVGGALISASSVEDSRQRT